MPINRQMQQMWYVSHSLSMGLPRWLNRKNPLASAEDTGDTGLIPGLGRSPGVGNGNLLQYSCLKFFRQEKLDREVWWATVNGLTKSQTQLVCVHTHTHTHTHTTHTQNCNYAR